MWQRVTSDGGVGLGCLVAVGFCFRSHFDRHPGLDPGSRFFLLCQMVQGGWVFMMADRYRGTLYVGVTTDLAARVVQHRTGSGSDFCRRYGLKHLVWAQHGPDITECIAHEKRLKKWRREWKIKLIEEVNANWLDLSDHLF